MRPGEDAADGELSDTSRLLRDGSDEALKLTGSSGDFSSSSPSWLFLGGSSSLMPSELCGGRFRVTFDLGELDADGEALGLLQTEILVLVRLAGLLFEGEAARAGTQRAAADGRGLLPVVAVRRGAVGRQRGVVVVLGVRVIVLETLHQDLSPHAGPVERKTIRGNAFTDFISMLQWWPKLLEHCQ